MRAAGREGGGVNGGGVVAPGTRAANADLAPRMQQTEDEEAQHARARLV